MRMNRYGLLSLAVLAGCGQSGADLDEVALIARQDTGRWYSLAQVEEGRQLYQAYCIGCHGPEAAGTSDWKKTDAQGNYPPPPLNGTAHAWHHPLSVLSQVIEQGGIPLGGQMPAFAGQFTEAQKYAIIAGFQQYWNDKIYDTWLIRERKSREQ